MEERFSYDSEILTKTSSGEIWVNFGGPAGGNVMLHIAFDCKNVFQGDLGVY